ncbi:MAG: glycosyltransferase [Prevotella sp.]|nr:glycosyltransferase [Prevotella sp.]
MHITLVHDHVLPIVKYGGTERVIWGMGRQLARMGHQVTFLAHKGSTCPFGRVVEINPEKSLGSQIPEDTDVVHFSNYVVHDDLTKPYVVTINGNVVDGEVDPNAVFVSRNHAERFGSKSFVYNGLDWDDYGEADLSQPRSHFHFLGKAAWRVKNVRGAIRIAKMIDGGHLDVLGGYRLNLKMGFRLTLSPRIHFYGMVDNMGKKRVIQQSRGMIFPVRWHEPFGLCLIESLYYGAPVYGTPMGSLPELIGPEVGFLSNDEARIADFINSHPDFSPKVCHEYAADKFNIRVMTEEYLKRFEIVMNGTSLKDAAQ